jgi:hypothetical protein
MKHLRELAKEFAQGKISRDEYRMQRSELIQGIMAGTIEVPDKEYLAPIPPPSEDDITAQGPDFDPFATTEIAVTKPGNKKKKPASPPTTPAEPGTAKSRTFPVWLFATLSIAVMVLIVAITALFIYSANDDTTSGESSVSSPALPAAGQAANQLIQLFLQRNDWQAESLEKFRQNWEKIGPSERQAALDLPVMNQLKNAIYQQILEERAMIALGDAESSRQKQQLLVDFAASLGIEDPKIKVGP